MYESPIEVFQNQMQLKLEGDIMSAVQEYGINVNREELVRALKYDRDQYTKGYNDAKAEQGDMIPVEWIQRYANACEAVSKTVGGVAAKLSAEAVRVVLDYWKEEQNGQTDKCRPSESET